MPQRAPISPWQKHLLKRTRQNDRLIKLAMKRLEAHDPLQLPPHHVLGVHLGLIVITNCSKLVDIRARTRWMLHWMLGYLIAQGYTVEETSTLDALDALEALVVGAAQAKQAHENQLQYRLGRLLEADGTPVPDSWAETYNSALTFINALNGIA